MMICVLHDIDDSIMYYDDDMIKAMILWY